MGYLGVMQENPPPPSPPVSSYNRTLQFTLFSPFFATVLTRSFLVSFFSVEEQETVCGSIMLACAIRYCLPFASLCEREGLFKELVS